MILDLVASFAGVMLNMTPAPVVTQSLVFDLSQHIGYIVDQDGKYTDSFKILTGQKRVVHYIGKTYFAATPAQSWTAKSLERKGDKVTFGQSGRFLRLSDEKGSTAYGIHPYKYFDNEVKRGNDYISMGCILVAESTMDRIQTIFEAQSSVQVITTFDPDEYVYNLDPAPIPNPDDYRDGSASKKG